MPANPQHGTSFKGWHYDDQNDRLELWYKGTEIWRVDTSGTTLVTGDFNSQADDVVQRYGGNVGLSWDTTDANANKFLVQLPAGGATDVPVIAIGQSIESVDQGIHDGAVDPTIAIFGVGARTTGPIIEFRKSRGTLASPTVVTAGDDMGTIDFYSAVAANEWVRGASIRADSTVGGTPATTRGPGDLSFSVATDAAPSVMTERLRINGLNQIVVTPHTDVQFANGTGIILGHTAQETISSGDGATDLVPEFQVLGTAQADGSAMLAVFSTTATRAGAPTLALVKGGDAAIGTHTIVTDDEVVGNIIGYADDGVDLETPIAAVQFVVDGTPAADQVGGSIEFFTTPDASSTLTHRMVLGNTGDLIIGDGTVRSHANMTGPGLIIDTRTIDTLSVALKSSSDVATGLTSGGPGQDVATDDIMVIGKLTAAEGGAEIQALAEDGGSAVEVLRIIALGGTGTTTDTAASIGLVNIVVAEHNASNATIAAPANQNILTVRACTAADTYETRLLLKGDDGELHLGNATPALLDTEDDIMLVRAAQRDMGGDRGVLESMYDINSPFHYDRLRALGIVSEKSETGASLFALQPRLALHEGAMWQLYTDLMDVVRALPASAQAKLNGRMQQRLAALPS